MRRFQVRNTLSTILLATMLILSVMVSLSANVKPAVGQAGEVAWIRQIGTSQNDVAVSVDGDGTSVYMSAFLGFESLETGDAILRRYDTAGNEIWTKSTLSLGYAIWGISADTGGFYGVGAAGEGPFSDPDIFVGRFDNDGNTAWTDRFGSSDFEIAYGVSAASTGVYVAGATNGTLPGESNLGYYDVFIRKYETNGNVAWTRQFGTSAFDSFFLGAAVSSDASGVYVTGITNGTFPGQTRSGLFDGFIRKYDLNGNEMWTRQFSLGSLTITSGISVDGTGVYVAGAARFDPLDPSDVGVFVRKYDIDGNEIWTRTISGTIVFGGGFSEVISADGSGPYVVGATSSSLSGQPNLGGFDVFVRKYDAAGNEEWTSQFGSQADEFGLGVALDLSGFYVVGYTQGALPGQTYAGGTDAFLAKITRGDTTAPNPPVLLIPTDGALIHLNTPAFDWSDVDDPSGVTYTLQVDNDEDFSSPEINMDQLTLSSLTLTAPLNDGFYYWRVRAVDSVGNQGAFSTVFTFKIAVTRLIVVKHVINDNGGTATAASFMITVTGSSPSPATFPGSEAGTTVMLTAGSYSVSETGPTLYAATFSTDCTGTIADGDVKTCTITNDDVEPPPDTFIVNVFPPIHEGGTTFSRSIAFVFTGTDNVGVQGFECSLDGSLFTACSSPVSYNRLTRGSHIFQVRAVDTAGLVDPTPATFNWTVRSFRSQVEADRIP